MNQWQRSEGKTEHKFSSNAVHQVHIKSLIKPSRSSLSATSSQIFSQSENLIEELQTLRWSEAMKCTNVLILDNCDDILISEYHQEFLTLTNILVTRSKFHKRDYCDFDCWTVKELNQSASTEILDKIAPAIDNESLWAAAELVEGCPLALKVIGQLLHIHGVKLMSKLKKEVVITILDNASIPKQRFHIIMDVAFERLGILKDYGYILSLFPGPFDEQAGTAIYHPKRSVWNYTSNILY